MMQLVLNHEDKSADFAGPMRLSVGFMQTVMELLTVPGDIFLDCNIGVGNTFWAGEFSGRFVIGMEEREQFVKEAAIVLRDISKREGKTVAQEKPREGKTINLEDSDDDELYNFRASQGDTQASGSQSTPLPGDV
jgi:hypothetical protein